MFFLGFQWLSRRKPQNCFIFLALKIDSSYGTFFFFGFSAFISEKNLDAKGLREGETSSLCFIGGLRFDVHRVLAVESYRY